ncbi:MAG: uracil-DNA glycosylase, partial [Acidobacteriota bacterium]|nr:uracil-DNA glycosylase [Acidobacteriota bacterium]
MKEEFSTFLADVKEQILYLQELGVENFEVDFPEINSPKSKVQSLKSEIPQERLEKFVRVDEALKSVATTNPKAENEETKTARRSLLESTKLSRLPSLPKSNAFPVNKINEQAREIEMPTKPIEEMPSLFSDDVKQTLPESSETIEEIRLDIGNCTRCPLHEGRTKIVHTTGSFQADLLFVGEAPGADEDASGLPFVGRAGQLLTKIIESIGLKREDVLIGNINRCRPPGNRQPTLPEAHTCRPFLMREIAVVRPRVIIVMGNTAMKNLLDTKEGITKLRGEFQDYFGVKVMPTFHPAYLLRDPSKKREVW